MFGSKAHIGLQSSQLPSSVINDLVTEELENVINSTDICNDNELSENTYSAPIAEEVSENIDSSENSALIMLTCSICEREDGKIYHCTECKASVHNFCGETQAESSNILCRNCIGKRDLISNKIKAINGIEEQSRKMLRLSEKNFHLLKLEPP